MKKLLVVLLVLFAFNTLAQTSTCITANPFCSDQTYLFPNVTGTVSPNGPNYGCLGTQPNPIWYYMEIDQSGPIRISMTQTNNAGQGRDIDFAMWGPFTSLSAGCAAIMAGQAPIQCSYSTAATETIGLGMNGGAGGGASTPPAAIAGQVYITLLTNFSNQAGNISFNQTAGTGSADCTILEPCGVTLGVNGLTVSACNPANNMYSVSGTVSIVNPPPVGTLIAQACNGTQSVIATAPFNASSYPFSIGNLPSNGAACNVNVFFSADNACALTAPVQYVAPLCPPLCDITNMTVNTGPCQEGSVFTLSGTLTFQNAPATGQLIIADCSNNLVTFNPPFSSPLNYSIPNVVADGAPCDLTAYFTASPMCSQQVSYNNTPTCVCEVELGTFTTSTAGNVSNNPAVLCFGDDITMTPNGNFVPPSLMSNPPLAQGYDPGIAWALYACPPSVGLNPASWENIGDDPCFLGFQGDGSGNFTSVNNMALVNQFQGDLVNNTIYWVPVTMYNMTAGVVSYINGGLPCYELGTATPVQYLPEITRTITPNCHTGQVSVTVSGGAPAVNGSNFTASNLLPANATFVNTTTGNGGTIVISGLTNNQNYSFQIADQYGCPVTVSGTFIAATQAHFSYPQASYCKGSANPSPVITGTPGGVFSGSTGLIINSSTGVINIANTPVGTYTVTYTSPGAPCNNTATFTVTINALPVLAVNSPSICLGQSATLTATGANTYTWSPATGLSATTGNPVQANPTASTTYTITGTNTTTGCSNTVSSVVTVNPLPAPVITGPATYCSNTSPQLQTTLVYTSYNWSHGASTQATTVNAASSPYTVTVTNQFGCTATSAPHTINVIPTVATSATVTICQGQSALIHGVSRTVAGVYPNTVTGSNGCDSTSTITLVVNPLPVISAGNNQTVCEGTSVILNATGAPTLTWSPAATNGMPFVPTVGQHVYTLTGTSALGCTRTATTTITVNPTPVPVIEGQTEYCAGSPAAIQTSLPYTTYQWSHGANTQSTFVTQVNNPITVTVANQFGCSATSAPYFVHENSLTITNSTMEICQGQSATIHGIVRTTAGTYTNVMPSVTGCDSTSNVTLIVNPLPVLNALPDITVCDGSSVTLSATGAPSLVWTPAQQNGIPFTPAVGSVTYNLVATSIKGCVSTDQVVVTVNPNPVVTISGPAEHCEGTPATFTPNAPFNTYAWSTGATTQTIQTTAASSPIQLTVTNQFGCSAPSNILTLIQNDLIETFNTYEICQGDQISVHGVMQSVAGLYTQVFTSQNGCDSTSNINLIVHDLPTVNAGVDQQVCDQSSVTLIATGASVITWDNNVLNAIAFYAPIGTTVYTATGVDVNGCVNTDQVEVVVLPIPVIDQLVDQLLCNNSLTDEVQFTADVTTATFEWFNNNTSIGLAATGTSNIAPFTGTNTSVTPAIANISVEPTAQGCLGNPTDFTITVQHSPTASIFGDMMVCLNDAEPQILFAGNNGGNPFSITYTINGGTPLVATTNGPSIYIGAPTNVAGTFVYSISSVEEAGMNCTAVTAGDVTIIVNDLPAVDAGPDLSICLGDQVTLTGSGAGQGASYVWTSGAFDGFPISPFITTNYSLTGVDVNGCSNTDVMTVTVNIPETVNAGTDTLICVGEMVTLQVVGGNPTSTYTWTNGVVDGVPFAITETDTFTVTSIDMNQCISTDEVIITVSPLPTVRGGYNISACYGVPQTFTGQGAGVGASYVWSDGILNGVPFIPAVGEYEVYVTGTNIMGCSNVDTISLKVDPLPVVTFEAEQTEFCVPGVAVFRNTSVNPYPTTCIWNFDDSTMIHSCEDQTISFYNQGMYGASLTIISDGLECTTSVNLEDLVRVDALPIANFAANSQLSSFIHNEVEFYNNSYGAVDYLWDFGDGVGTSIEENPRYTFTEEVRVYNVRLIAFSENGCPDTSHVAVQIREDLLVFVPNSFTPGGDEYNEVFLPVFTAGFDPMTYKFMVFNRWGEMIFESYDATRGWPGTYGPEGFKCQSGTYVYKIEFKLEKDDDARIISGHVNLLR